MNKELNKVIVFDLDGTLWQVNSHIDIIQKYYEMNSAVCLIQKIFGKCIPYLYLIYLNALFTKIPDSYIENYQPEFRKDALQILHMMQAEGYTAVIISLAPQRILDTVSKRLSLPVIKGKAGKKSDILKQYISGWEKLMVVTDNLSDCDLINLSDKAIVYTVPRCVGKFKHKCSISNIDFRDRRLE